jgi:hypothetical protein
MLGTSSATYRRMDSDNRRGNSSMTRALSSRRDLVLERRAIASNRALQEAIQIAARQETQRAKQQDTKRSTERLAEGRDNRKVISLLERIADSLQGLDRGGGLGNIAGSVLGGAALSRLLAASGSRAARRSKLVNEGNRWRDPKTGRYAKAPTGTLQRIARSVSESPVGKVAGAISNSRMGKAVGAVARSPLGRITGQAGRLGLNMLGKVAAPIAIGMGIYDGVNGMRNADKILGRKTNESERAQVGMAQVVNGFLLGLPDWLSKRVFGQSFAKLMVDGLDDVQKQVHERINNIWNGTRSMISAGLGSVTNVMHTAIDGMQKYGAEISAAGATLIAAIKAKDMPGAVRALGALNSVIMKPGVAAARGAQAATKATGRAVAQGARTTSAVVADAGSYAAGKISTGATQLYGSMRGSLNKAASTFGLDRATFAASAAIESGFRANAKAKTSSATGTFQFINGTWMKEAGDLVNHPQAPAGLRAYAGLFKNGKFVGTPAQKKAFLDLRYQADISNFVGASFTARNNRMLAASGIAATGGNAYLAHFLGIGGAKKLLSADPNAAAVDVVGRDAANANKSIFFDKSGRAKTVREIAQWAADKVGKHRAQVLAMDAKLGGNDFHMASTEPSAANSNIKVASSMGKARAAKASTASMAPVKEPLTQALPEPAKSQPDLQKPVRDLQALHAASQQPSPAPVSKQASLGGRGGLPSVGDVADRPRIDLQAITTTLAGRG